MLITNAIARRWLGLMIGNTTRIRSRVGSTEAVWHSLPEEKKLLWKLATWAVAFIASHSVLKTGVALFDTAIMFFSTLTTLLIVESQRNLSRYTIFTHNLLLRTTLFLSVLGTKLMTICVFLLAAYVVEKYLFLLFLGLSNALIWPFSPVWIVIALFSYAYFLIEFLKMFRELKIEKVYSRWPVIVIKQLIFVTKGLKPNQFKAFMYSELFVISCAYFYFSMISEIVRLFIDATKF